MASYHYKKMHMPRQHSCRAMYIEHSITPWMKGEWNSHRIWISMVKSFVNWTPRPELNQDFACWGPSHEDLRCHNYPRPVLAFWYCHCLRLWVCVSVCVCVFVYQSRACPPDNSWPIQARITKFEPDMQNTLVEVPIVFGDDRPWSSRSNLTWKSHFELVHTITHQPFKLEPPNVDRKCILALLRSLLILDLIGFDLHFHFQSWNLFFYQTYLHPLYIFSETRRL